MISPPLPPLPTTSLSHFFFFHLSRFHVLFFFFFFIVRLLSTRSRCGWFVSTYAAGVRFVGTTKRQLVAWLGLVTDLPPASRRRFLPNQTTFNSRLFFRLGPFGSFFFFFVKRLREKHHLRMLFTRDSGSSFLWTPYLRRVLQQSTSLGRLIKSREYMRARYLAALVVFSVHYRRAK